jgi:hypothetical protein
MPYTVERTAFKYDELSDKAKERVQSEYARDLPYFWTESIYDDAARIGDILGIDIRTRSVKTIGGVTRMEPCIYWSGFWSQGDGACFEGFYKYAKGSTKKIREYAPKDEVLHKIADRLYEVQRKCFYKLTASVKHSGHYYHEYCTDILVDLDEEAINSKLTREEEEEVKDCLRDFMRWIYAALEKEYEYQTSEEVMKETIEANEWDFDEYGNLI